MAEMRTKLKDKYGRRQEKMEDVMRKITEDLKRANDTISWKPVGETGRYNHWEKLRGIQQYHWLLKKTLSIKKPINM
ncbi:hypothetical protein DPEC_G00079130 [Dallia pectoralis]|uniref:Uncharacterized protein n=1 Tax=Dallia pectoralis TaxID=75939 RepID=A0ACC2H5J5_DALPE|nr:hypothetical protein DPEC_G00079130 [Dallia pectoralis]